MAFQDLRAKALDIEALEKLNERIKRVYNHLAMGIGMVSRLTGASPVQLRYWEKQGLTHYKDTGNGRRREYSLADLKRLMWITQVLSPESAESAKPADIVRFFEEAPQPRQLLDAILAYQQPGPVVAMPVERNLDTITRDSFYQFLCPRLGEIILTLLWGSLRCNTGFVIPVSGTEEYPLLENGDINEALRAFGESVLCFADGDSTVHFWIQNPMYFENPNVYRLEQAQIESDVFQRPVYLLGPRRHPLPAPRTDLSEVLARLLKLILRTTEDWKRTGFATFVYSSHTTPADLTLSHMKMLTDRIVELADARESAWSFCCLLTPANPEDPRHHHTLTIIAQSRKSPHCLGTTLKPREGISSFAYLTGQVVNVRFAEQERRIARYEGEKDTQSAIAIPIGCLADSDAILYVASDHPEAFTGSDELILALLGHLMATRPTLSGLPRQACASRIQSIVSNPQVMDPLFQCFHTSDQFLRAIEERIEQIRGQSPGKSFALLTVDIDESHKIWEKHRDTAILKGAWQWVGKATRNALGSTVGTEIELYRIYVDRYAAILDTGHDGQEILNLGKRLHETLRVGPVHVDHSALSSPPVKFTTRVAVVLADSEEVEALPMNSREIRQLLVDRLHGVLRFGKVHKGDHVAYWSHEGPKRFDG
jgi:hypothetical protein